MFNLAKSEKSFFFFLEKKDFLETGAVDAAAPTAAHKPTRSGTSLCVLNNTLFPIGPVPWEAVSKGTGRPTEA